MLIDHIAYAEPDLDTAVAHIDRRFEVVNRWTGSAPVVHGSEVGEDGQRPAVAVGILRDIEPEQYVAYVNLDRTLAQDEPLGDGVVGKTLGHQRQDLPLPLGQTRQWTTTGRRNEPRDDLGVQRRAAKRDALRRGEELADLEDAILEQVAESGSGNELDRVGGLYVLGQHKYTDIGMPVLRLPRGARTFVGVRGRHAYVDDHEVRLGAAEDVL